MGGEGTGRVSLILKPGVVVCKFGISIGSHERSVFLRRTENLVLFVGYLHSAGNSRWVANRQLNVVNH